MTKLHTPLPKSNNCQHLFVDDQVIIADTEDNLQKAAHKLNQIITEYGLTISVQKTKSMAFQGRDPVRTKIVIDNKIIGQVNSFNHLGSMISYVKELDIDNKITQLFENCRYFK